MSLDQNITHVWLRLFLLFWSLLFIMFMLWTYFKESPMMKPSARISRALASIQSVHTLCLSTRFQKPLTPHCKHVFLFCFSYWLVRFNSQQHRSASTNEVTSGLGTLRFIQTNWSMWCVLVALMTVSLQCWSLADASLKNDSTFCSILLVCEPPHYVNVCNSVSVGDKRTSTRFFQ